MKRLIYGAFIGLIIAIAILIMVIVQSSDTAMESAVGEYLRYAAASEPGITASMPTRARRPWHFTPQMSSVVFGYSSYFHTDVTYGGGSQDSSSRPLPYPPDDLYCVWLHAVDRRAVVFVARHTDDWHGEWMVHRSAAAWPSDELRAQLSAIGCDPAPSST